MSTGRSSGATVIEVMVASTLLFGLTMSMAFIFRSNYEYRRRSEAKLDLNQSCLLAISKLRRDLSESNLPTIRADSATRSVVFPSPRNLAGRLTLNGGNLEWSKVVCYRFDSGSQTLFRQEEASTASSQAIDPLDLLPPRDAAYFIANTSLPSMPIANGVKEFEVTRDAQIATSVKVRLGLSRQVGERDFGMEISCSVSPRN